VWISTRLPDDGKVEMFLKRSPKAKRKFEEVSEGTRRNELVPPGKSFPRWKAL